MGLHSYVEAANAGIPLIGIPLFADQFYNMAAAIDRDIGIKLDKDNLTYETIVKALHEILYNAR
jgi:glucuronosyltransferase